jgi:glycerol-3-phosphate dehydrogenase (NAD(P)+)
MKCAVVGAGSWGTALSVSLCATDNHEVVLWDHDTARAERIESARENERYMPGVRLPPALRVTGDLRGALDGAGFVLSVVPSQATRALWAEHGELLSSEALICCASKGVENSTLETMEKVLEETLGLAFLARLSFLCGPSFAKEVAQGLPAAVVVAARHGAVAQSVAETLHTPTFRVYTTDDVTGAEVGAALKNVIAIACGVVDGMGLGLNARAALITRGLAEITRLAVALGGNPLTLAGLAGTGDLVLTCTGDLSRNRRVGLGLGHGKTLPQILKELGQVAEGVVTAKSAHDLAKKMGVDMPISEEIYLMLYENKPVGEALRDLMGRQRRSERG